MRFTSIPFKLAAGALILAAGTAFAQPHVNHDMDYKNEAPPCPCPPTLMDGFYLGAEVSYDVITTHSDFDATDDISVSGSPMLAARGWDGGLFLGYGRYLTDVFYIGAEVFGYWSGASQSLTVTTPEGFISANMQANGSYGVAILPGLKLNQTTLAYAKVGYVWSNIHSSANLHINFDPTTGGPFNASGSSNNNISGWEFGLGLETLLVDNWSIRADYTYVDYNSSNNNFLSSFNPRDNVFTAGIVYHFNF